VLLDVIVDGLMTVPSVQLPDLHYCIITRAQFSAGHRISSQAAEFDLSVEF